MGESDLTYLLGVLLVLWLMVAVLIARDLPLMGASWPMPRPVGIEAYGAGLAIGIAVVAWLARANRPIRSPLWLALALVFSVYGATRLITSLLPVIALLRARG
jgi:hypothetical protein